MARFAQVSAHGISIHLPAGWDAEIYVRDLDGDPTDDIVDLKPVHARRPTSRCPRAAATSARSPSRRWTDPASSWPFSSTRTRRPAEKLFRNQFPSAARRAGVRPEQPAAPPARASGCAAILFSSGGRAFCVYAVLGNYAMRTGAGARAQSSARHRRHRSSCSPRSSAFCSYEGVSVSSRAGSTSRRTP